MQLSQSQAQITKAHLSEAFMLTSLIKEELTIYYYERGHWPNKKIYDDVDSSKIIESILFDGLGSIHITFSNYLKQLEGKTLSFIASLDPEKEMSNIIWNCGFNKPIERHQLLSENLTNIHTKQLSMLCR